MLDSKIAVEKLYRLFGIDTLLICGGGTINWTFLQQGAVDELSLLIAPAADGNPDSVTVFEKSALLPPGSPAVFQLKRYLFLCMLLLALVLGGCTGTRHSFQTTPTPLAYEYETQELYAKRDENRIYGVVYVPQNAGEKMPAVIFSHGFGGNYQVGTQYAEALAAKGYVVYCFDFCGGSPGSRSDGSTLEMSIFTEQADLEAVIGMVQELPYVDNDNIFLMGTSMGGAVSAITAAAHEDEIQGAILLYPAFVLVDNANEQFESVEDIPDTYHLMWMTVGHVFAEDLMQSRRLIGCRNT